MERFCREDRRIGESMIPVGARSIARSVALSCAAVAAFGVVATVGDARAGEQGHRLGASADIKGWIDGLANRNGANCCSDAEGVKPQEVAWQIGKSQYRVRVRDQWIDVPEGAVIQGPN